MKTRTDHVLEVMLTEYKSRVTEIQNRSLAENTFLQIHITALSAILTGIITFPQNGQWLLFIIPIESSLFGLWLMGNSSSILHNGAYIRKIIEPKINKLLGYKHALFWETYIRIQNNLSNKSETPIQNLVFLTFELPSIISILTAVIYIFLSFGHIRQFYTETMLPFAVICVLVNIFSLLTVFRKTVELGKLLTSTTINPADI